MENDKPSPRVFAAIAAAVAMCACGCTDYHRTGADKAAYRTLTGGQAKALGEPTSFDVEYSPVAPEGNDPVIRVDKKAVTIGKGEPVKLTLEECLAVAVRTSRDLQDRKEELYSGALAVANGRRSWDWPLMGLDLTGEAEHTKVNSGAEDRAGEGEGGLSIAQRFVNGGVFTLAYALNVATDFVAFRSQTLGAAFDASFTQPLLRGAWRGLAYETQYRLERDFLFDVFAYERFTQTFAAGIVTQYYSVLQNRDELENEQANIERLKQTLALTRVLVEGGQVSKIQEDQAEQNLLNAQTRLERTAETFRNSLDAFKVTLGLPVTADATVDYPAALAALRKVGPREIPFKEDQAIGVALSVRPDLLTERAEVRDADRDVEIAADAFYPQLDVTLGITAADSGADRSSRLQWRDHVRTSGVTFQYSFDQTDNRDAYRNAMLTAAGARRDLAEFEDNVRLSVRRSYRSLAQSRRSYELQLRSVEIARRRRKLAALQQKEGQASARDVLEAEEALRNAQNGLTQSLVSYTTTRLNFLADLGMIVVDEKGGLHEREEPFRFERIGRRYKYVAGQ